MDQAVELPSVAVIGAGMAGISCALSLVQSGYRVTVFEQAAFPGGRMASKTYGDYQFDSGAQYFTVRSDAFRTQVQKWRNDWLIEEWQAWLVDLEQGEALSHSDGVSRYIGRPVMHSIIEDMAELCDVRYSAEIKNVRYQKANQKWELVGSFRKKLGEFDVLIVAVPAPQAVPFLKPAKQLVKLAESVDMTACWAVMLAFEEPLQLGFDGAYVASDQLSWIVRDSAKIERENAQGIETWVLHAAPEWSDKHIKLAPKKVIATMLEFMQQVTARNIPKPVFSAAELWPFAKPLNPLNVACLYDADLCIGACGDWCYAAKAEGAYLSGIRWLGECYKMLEGQRLDKWLWVARFYKSRTLATEAVNGGKVHCNAERSKPGKSIKPGDKLVIRKGVYEYEVIIEQLSLRRLSAPDAQKLYIETENSQQARELRQQQSRAERMSMPVTDRRPSKRDRRKLVAIKNRQLE